MFDSWRKSREALEEHAKAETVALAKKHGFKIYEIERYDGWAIKVVLPNSTTSLNFDCRHKKDGYLAAAQYIERWTWKDKEERIL